MPVVGAKKLEIILRKAASLDIDHSKAKSITDIVEQKLYDLLLIGERNANFNSREVIWEADVPLTKGFLETIQKFKKLEEEIEAQDILNFLATMPPLKYPLEIELENKLPEIVGALLFIVANLIKEISPGTRKPSEEDIEKARHILNLTM
ncbi:MAG: DUF1931 family protein [Aquificae bacterium]|nr:DUF1931 family protein [Aquificota bacterium]